MEYNKNKLKILAFIVSILLLQMLAIPVALSWSPSDNLWNSMTNELDPLADIYGAEGEPEDPRVTAMRITNYALGFLSVVFIALILYAGFRWMTSGGNEEHITKAKKIMIASVIGLGIVLTALAITNFIFRVLIKGTGF